MLGGIIPNWVKRHFEKFPFPKDLQIATNFISTSYEPDALELVPNESRELELTSKMDNSMDISRFFDWESFCLADRYGCGFVFVRLRARRQNVSSSDFRSTSGLPIYIFRMSHHFHRKNMTHLRPVLGALGCSLVWFMSDVFQTPLKRYLFLSECSGPIFPHHWNL